MSVKESILVIDDEPDIRQNLKDLLAKYYRVMDATDLPSAAVVLSEHADIRVVLTDYQLDDQPGTVVIRALLDKFPHIQPIIMTAYADEETLSGIRSQGINHVLLKPFLRQELLDMISGVSEEWDDCGVGAVGR